MLSPVSSLVSLTSAGVYRDRRWLARGIDLEIAPGEIVTLIGPNGAGKSTIAKMALGVLPPDEGKAWMKPDIVVGYVPQKFSIDWTLPLKVRRLMSLTTKIGRSQIDEALEKTGTRHLINADVKNLSGGEFQRVLLARAIARNPDLLVLDEPVQGVDFKGEIALYELISKIRDLLGCGIMLISHDLHVVMSSTDRVVCVNNHICCSGSPKTVAENPEYQALFGPRATSTHAVYQHAHDHTHLPDGRIEHADGSITELNPMLDGHHHHSTEERDENAR